MTAPAAFAAQVQPAPLHEVVAAVMAAIGTVPGAVLNNVVYYPPESSRFEIADHQAAMDVAIRLRLTYVDDMRPSDTEGRISFWEGYVLGEIVTIYATEHLPAVTR